MKNIVKSSLTEAEREQLKSLLSQIKAILHGKLAVLTKAERSRFGSINEKNKLLVNSVRQFYRDAPELSSPDIDWDEFEADYQARVFLETFLNSLSSLLYDLESSKILHDYDNYQDALREYKYSQYKNEIGEEGYSVKVVELRQLFNRTGTFNKIKEKNKDKDKLLS